MEEIVLATPRCSRGVVSVARPYNTDYSVYSLSPICETIAAFLCLELMQFDMRLFHGTKETNVVKVLGCTTLGTFLLNSPSFSLFNPYHVKESVKYFLIINI